MGAERSTLDRPAQVVALAPRREPEGPDRRRVWPPPCFAAHVLLGSSEHPSSLHRIVRKSFDELGADCVCCYVPSRSTELILSLRGDDDAGGRWADELAQMVLAVARVGAEPWDPQPARCGRVPLMLASQYLVVPIVGFGFTLGALGVASVRTRLWSASHVATIRRLAREAASAGG